MGASTGPATDAAVGGAVAQEARYHWGMAGTWKVNSAALQGDEPASLLAGDVLELSEGFSRLFVDVPITQSATGRLFLRFQATVRVLHGHIDGLTVGGLKKLSPGLIDLITETADDFEDVPGVEEISDRGRDLANQALAKEVHIHDAGIEPGLLLCAGGPSWHLWSDLFMDSATFGIGAFFHLSRTTVTLTKNGAWKTDHFLGLDGGLTMHAAFLTIYGRDSGVRFQPAAIELNAFGRVSDGRLRALVAEVALLTEVSWDF